MPSRLLIVTPPFTQLNTPYPASMYLKGFLNTLSIPSRQADLGIEVIHGLFSYEGMSSVFETCEAHASLMDENLHRIFVLRDLYLKTVQPVMDFLSGKNQTLAYRICDRNYLPEASRFEQADGIEDYFGNLGIVDKAKHLATLYLEDLGDLITAYVDPYFGFNRYAESLARSASSFDSLYDALKAEDSIVTALTKEALEIHISIFQPSLLCISVPFPGNLFGALKCAQYVKTHHPNIKVCMGGGYVNTELRTIRDERFFDFIDFLSLDDGEMPLTTLIEHLDGNRSVFDMKRVFSRVKGVVHFCNGASEKDIPQRETGIPDYSDLFLDKYLTILELTNPMHRLWSDGRWNKLTMAHGCYWGKCSFCDISLDYISRYEPISASILCDRIEAIIAQTGEHGFHFVDEAAPPALMMELAVEIIRRKLTVTWWTNIRFEKTFTPGLCRLLRESGCIAVSGGLEVASDRLLALMQKGVTVAQVTRVCGAFTQAGIMVHAYLMYGFPTQTDQESIDSLEVVRQLFNEGVVQSGFWHRFAMTSHSPIGLAPQTFQVEKVGPVFDGFADNDNYHSDPLGGNHESFDKGLKTSIYNYMNGEGLDLPLQHWFEEEVPKTHLDKALIASYLQSVDEDYRINARVIFLGNPPSIHQAQLNGYCDVHFYGLKEECIIELNGVEARWIVDFFPSLIIGNGIATSLDVFSQSYHNATGHTMTDLLNSELWDVLKEMGLIVV